MHTPITTRIHLAFVLLVLLSNNIAAETLGTAFTYQGRLNDGANAANGRYDFTFRLYDAGTNGSQVGAAQTNAAVAASNGFFTVTLDFGSGAFTGSARWLAIGVRTNASAGAYTPLSPRQTLLATPYALYVPNAGAATTANSAFSVTTNGVNGAAIQDGAITTSKIGSGQVVKSLNGLTDAVTLSAGANITLAVSGTDIQIASGNGGGAGLTWQMVTGTSQVAQANSGYIVTNAAQVAITLPSAPSVGTSVRVVGAGPGGWKIAQNSGQSILAGNSAIAGTSISAYWSPRETSRSWSSVASSADGSKLVAAVNGGQIYVSSDSGVSWTPRESVRGWASVASSADGTKLVAVVNGGQIYSSSDAGVSWTPRDSAKGWKSAATSADGTKSVALADGGQIYTSASALFSGNATTVGPAGFLVGGPGAALELLYVGNNQFAPLSCVPTIAAY